MKETEFSIRQRRGKVVDVYDGRRWPVVRCGSVYITPSDNTNKVTQAVVCAPSVNEKKRRAAKYTVAVGTSHGHVQAFLKDSDIVLAAYDQCAAEEKCLILIKKPKDSSKKMLKAHSVNSLSMSDTQLYRQFDGTASYSAHTAHRLKNSGQPENNSVISEVYHTEPRVRTGGNQSKTHHSTQPAKPRATAARTAPFVPIPELGIFTPDQHVLQNGSYAQHCHQREVNNNTRNRISSVQSAASDQASRTSTAYSSGNANSSFNSSFEESVNNFDSGGFRKFPPVYEGRTSDVYHSCVDISHNDGNREFGTLSSTRSYDCGPIQEVDDSLGTEKAIESSARSHSLGDLSKGLTFSLVGQKKADSSASVSGQNTKSSNKTSKGDPESSSALKHIRERLQRAMNSQHRKGSNSKTTSNFHEDAGFDPSKYGSKSHASPAISQQPSSSSSVPSSAPNGSQSRISSGYQRQHSAPQPAISATSPPIAPSRRRRDSEETTSSYRSAMAEPQQYSARVNHVPNSHSANSLSQVSDAGDGKSSPSKTRRSLPSVPDSETSERLRRVTEMMKSRMSNHSSSGSRNGYSSTPTGYTPPQSGYTSTPNGFQPMRIPSVESSESVNLSRKSSMENSDYESTHNNYPRRQDRPPQPQIKPKVQSSKLNNAPFNDGKRAYNAGKTTEFSAYGNNVQTYNADKAEPQTAVPVSTRLSTNVDEPHDTRRTSFGGSVPGPSRQRPHVEETPLPPGDRSSDSGHTTVTNHSYNGSAFDSGYATNNDGENDSFNLHHHHQHQQQQHYNQNPLNNQHLHHRQEEQRSHSHQQDTHSARPAQRHEYTPRAHNDNNNNAPYGNQPNTAGNQQNQIKNNLFSANGSRGPPPVRENSNLANAHRFGSVQNVSSSQAHGLPSEAHAYRKNPYFHHENYDKPLSYQHGSNNGAYSAREFSTNGNERGNSGFKPAPIKGELLPVTKQLVQTQEPPLQRSANRRSWDYSEVSLNSDPTRFQDNRIRHYNKSEQKFRSTEVLSSSYYQNRDYNSYGNFSSRTEKHNNAAQQHISNSTPRDVSNKQNLNNLRTVFEKASAPLNSMSHSYHGELDKERTVYQPPPGDVRSSHNNVQESSDNNGFKPQPLGDKWNAETHRKAEPANGESPVKQRPVPLSRSNRHARGHTLPGGFRFFDTDSSLANNAALEVSLFHVTQKYDLSPLLLNLPKHQSLKDFIHLKEITLEISLAGVPGLPSSPQGHTAKIGSPGSAFTPVRHPQDTDVPLVAKVKVLSFSQIWDEVHQHTTLGRVLDGDILLEINGWFCLGADTTYLTHIVETCQGAITITVARPKETDEARFKGQTPAERVKGLEAEIARLDRLIQQRDVRIKELTSRDDHLTLARAQGIRLDGGSAGGPVLTQVNGQVPCEGMVIGDDEYVV